MNDFDDLDELEQALGPSLRVALRRAAVGITSEPLLAAHGLSRSAVEAPAARIDDTAAPLDASEDKSADVTVVDIQSAGRKRTARSRWLLAAAVVAAVLLVAATVLVQGTGVDDIRTKVPPAGPSPTTTMLTPPSTAPGDGSVDGLLLPEGAPSTPDTGELVASVALIHSGAYHLYADGRLIWLSDDGKWVEQRLTPEGVERVRSDFLSSGVFDSTQAPSNVPPCTDVFQVCVRDSGRLLSVPARERAAEATNLLSYLRNLDSFLPATGWADSQIKPYASSKIVVCLRMYVDQAEVPPDLSILLPMFPARAADLLGGREPIDPSQMAYLIPDLTFPEGASCFQLTLDEARTLADALLDPSSGASHEYWGLVLRKSDPTRPGVTRPAAAYILFRELLPDGVPTLFPG